MSSQDMIIYQLIERIEDTFNASMNIGTSGSGAADWIDFIKFGRLQDSPIEAGRDIHLSLSFGSQQNPDLADGICVLEEIEKIAFLTAPREIGRQVEYWWRRGVIEINCYFISRRLAEKAAAAAAYSVLGRVTNILSKLHVMDLVDPWGERALLAFVVSSSYFESGGKDQYIWRGRVKFQVLTERNIT